MGYIDFDKLAAAQVSADPFPYLVLQGVIAPELLARVVKDFPDVGLPGVLPIEEVTGGEAFQAVAAELASDRMRDVLAQLFGVDLTGNPPMVTLRSRSRSKDGRIHADATFKKVTALIYLNDEWGEDGGNLRLLRSPDNLEDYKAEVPPVAGTLLAFKCTENAWHGHKPFIGRRQSLMLNYCVNEAARTREVARHRFSIKLKRLKMALGLEKVA